MCDWLEKCFRPRWFVTLWCWCICPPAWAVQATAPPVFTLAQQPGYLCGAVQARAPLPSPFLLFIGTLLLSCSRISIPIHLLNKTWESGHKELLFPVCLSRSSVYSQNGSGSGTMSRTGHPSPHNASSLTAGEVGPEEAPHLIWFSLKPS